MDHLITNKYFYDLRLRRFTDDLLTRSLADGTLTKLTPEIAVDAAWYEALAPWDRAQTRAIAHGLSADRAVIVASSAARIHKLPVLGAGQTVELCYPNGHAPNYRTLPRGVYYRRSTLPTTDILELDGYRVTTIARTLMDVARFHGLTAGVVAMDYVMREHNRDHDWLYQHLTEGRRYPRLNLVRQAISLSDARSESPLESQARIQLWEAGIDDVVPQATITLDGTEYRLDFLVNGWIDVEIDGESKYHGAYGLDPGEAIRAERRREKLIQNAGIRVLRFGAADLRRNGDGPSRFTSDIRRVIEQGRRVA